MFGIPMSELPSLVLADGAVISSIGDMEHALCQGFVADWLMCFDMD